MNSQTPNAHDKPGGSPELPQTGFQNKETNKFVIFALVGLLFVFAGGFVVCAGSFCVIGMFAKPQNNSGSSNSESSNPSVSSAERALLKIDIDNDADIGAHWERGFKEGARYGGNLSEEGREEVASALEKAHARQRERKKQALLKGRLDGVKYGWRTNKYAGENVDRIREELEKRKPSDR